MGADPGVLDASVAVKCFLDETGSVEARRWVAACADWAAPDLIFLEVASVALKVIRRGLLDTQRGAAMVERTALLLAETTPAAQLCGPAFRLAAEHGFSAYDAAYLALARQLKRSLLTADERLAERARQAGLGDLVVTLADA